MAAYIQVVLQQDIPALGKSGEVVKVRPGYARNYLIPRHLALPATARNVAKLEHDKAIAAARAAKLKAEALVLAEKIGNVSVQVGRKVGEGDRLFGSVTAKDIAAALEAQGIVVDRKKIELDEPLKALGNFEVRAKLAHDVEATIKVAVVAEG